MSSGTAPQGQPPRTIRSFVRRAGRITRAQRRALDTLWPTLGVELPALALPQALFPRPAPLMLEIGFGMGDALAQMAARHPQRNYLGVDVYPPGIGSALMKISQQKLDNVRLARADAVELMDALPAASLGGVLLFFPDPWPKKRHHKRRLVQAPFVGRVYEMLAPGGRFELATDWAPYAMQMMTVIEAHGGFDNLAGAGRYAPRPEERPQTRFERRGEKLGHPIFDLIFERKTGRALKVPAPPPPGGGLGP